MNYPEFFQNLLVEYVYGFIIALLILSVGLAVIKLVIRLTKRRLENKLDPTLSAFFLSALKTILLLLLIITSASTVGIEMTSFIAILGAASFAVALALQGSLSNFAGGVLLLIFKPFKAGDFVEAAGQTGKVLEVQLLHTLLNTPDNRKVYIPNGSLSNQTIINYTANETRRLDLKFGIGYEYSFEEAKNIIRGIIEEHEKILREPEPLVRLGEHAESSLEIFTRVWVNTPDYWDVYYDLHEEVKRRFDEENIGIPYPQLDLHFDSPVNVENPQDN